MIWKQVGGGDFYVSVFIISCIILDFVQPVSSSRKSLEYYSEGAKEPLNESPLPPLPSSNNNSPPRLFGNLI